MEMINFLEEIDTKGFTIIIPSVSVGNIGQLTVDLIISSYGFKKFATIWDPAIIPVVGGNAITGNSDDLNVSCELYVNKKLRMVVMQIRSGIEFKLMFDFLSKLKQLIMQLNIKEVIILTSVFRHELHDINTSSFRYISNDNLELFQKKNILPMETNLCGRYELHGGGFAVKLHEMLITDVKCNVLIQYCYEGDNRSDAMHMLEMLQDLKDITFTNVVPPYSWQYVFGNPPPFGIY